MPSLSFIVSAALVGAGSLYLYISNTQKLEEAKQKIQESKKVVYLSKKTSLTLSSVNKYDTNNSVAVMASTGDKLSNFVAKDKNLSDSELKMLDKLQSAIEKLVLENKTPSCDNIAKITDMSIQECLKYQNPLSAKKYNFYGLSASGVEIPKESLIKDDIKLKEHVAFSAINEKITEKKIEQFEIIKETKEKITENFAGNQELKDKLKEKEIISLEKKLKSLIEEKSDLEKYKLSLLKNISSLKKSIQGLEEEKNSLNTELKEATKTSNLKTVVTTIIGRVKTIFTHETDDKEETSNNDSKTNILKTKISQVSSSIEQNEKLIKINDEKIKQTENKLDSLEKEITKIKQEIENKKQGLQNA